MRGIVKTLALVTVLVLTATLPAAAAPDNKNTTDVVVLDCGEPIDGVVAIRPAPGEGGKSGWNVETGDHYVAKAFESRDEVTVSITDGPEVSAVFEFAEEFGASAPAKGRKDLVECTDTFEFEDGPFPIDAEFADILNAEFDTDIFEAGQEITISSLSAFTVLVLVPGS